jgi:hypothetical protein
VRDACCAISERSMVKHTMWIGVLQVISSWYHMNKLKHRLNSRKLLYPHYLLANVRLDFRRSTPSFRFGSGGQSYNLPILW